MGGNGSDEVMVSAVDEAEGSETTVEIKIKTLDSQTYTLRVNKRVPVPELKEQIETVTGVVTEQQRLICRGKVLKDDQLLSAYHVEDGHTLHMVVRQPILPAAATGFTGSESLPDPASDPDAGSGQSGGTHVAHRVLLGSFNIADQGDGGIPDLNRIISAVLSSIGIPNVGSSVEGSDPMEPGSDRLERGSGISVTSDSSQLDQSTARVQFDPLHGAFRVPSASTLGTLQPPVIPDSLTTLLQYLSHLRHEFTAIGGVQSSTIDGRQRTEALHSDVAQAGLPTAASLAEVLLSTRQLLAEQAEECLSQLAGQLQEQSLVTFPSLRNNIQTNAYRTGISLQNLGALLLELGRTTMTLRMGQTPSDAVVNAGPAVFISSTGPNPVMVQPLQPGAGLGANPLGTLNAGSGLLGGTLGSGLFPRNIDIRIRAGPSSNTGNTNQGDQSGEQQNPAQSGPERVSSSAGSVHRQGTGLLRATSFSREAGVRVVPIRTVVAAVPASVSRPTSNSSGSSMGLFYPLLARMQHMVARESPVPYQQQPSNAESNTQQIHDPAVQQQNGTGEAASPASLVFEFHRQGTFQMPNPGSDAMNSSDNAQQGGEVRNDEGSARQIPRSGQVPAGSTNTQGGNNGDTANSRETAPRLGLDEGVFLSRLLQQIIPLIPQNSDAEPGDGSHASGNSPQQASRQSEGEPSVGASHSRNDRPTTPPSPKRQKRE